MTTHDTPEAALAAALHDAGVNCTARALVLHEEDSTRTLAAMPGWTLVNAERLAAVLPEALADEGNECPMCGGSADPEDHDPECAREAAACVMRALRDLL